MLAGKRLELLKETIPKLSRVAVLWNPQNAGSAQVWKESQLPARELGLQLHSMEVNSADKFESAFKEAIKARSGALAVDGEARCSLPIKNESRTWRQRIDCRRYIRRGDFVESGGLMSYGADRIEPYQRAAVMVDKILKGAKPADLPVEQPTKFELMINLKDRQGAWPDDSTGGAHAGGESHQVRRGVSDECRVRKTREYRRR